MAIARATGRRAFALLLVSGLIVTGCAPGVLAADAPHFEGLDTTLVAEVLDDPVARRIIHEEPRPTRPSMAQGIARNFAVCRDALRVYLAWRGSPTPPPLAGLPVPEHPEEPSHADWAWTYEELEAVVESGRIERLEDWLTREGSCGRWIPAEPGDAETIDEVVRDAPPE